MLVPCSILSFLMRLGTAHGGVTIEHQICCFRSADRCIVTLLLPVLYSAHYYRKLEIHALMNQNQNVHLFGPHTIYIIAILT